MPVPRNVTRFHGKIKVNTWTKDDFYSFRNLLQKEEHRKHKIVLQNTMFHRTSNTVPMFRHALFRTSSKHSWALFNVVTV